MKVGDLVKVKYSDYDWIGVFTWTCGYKYTFALLSGGEETWTINDLEVVGARVLSESR